MRERNALGQLTPVGIGQGTVNVSGTLNCYFDNKDLAERVLDGTTQGLTLTFDCSQNVGDAGGSALGIYMPRGGLHPGCSGDQRSERRRDDQPELRGAGRQHRR